MVFELLLYFISDKYSSLSQSFPLLPRKDEIDYLSSIVAK